MCRSFVGRLLISRIIVILWGFVLLLLAFDNWRLILLLIIRILFAIRVRVLIAIRVRVLIAIRVRVLIAIRDIVCFFLGFLCCKEFTAIANNLVVRNNIQQIEQNVLGVLAWGKTVANEIAVAWRLLSQERKVGLGSRGA